MWAFSSSVAPASFAIPGIMHSNRSLAAFSVSNRWVIAYRSKPVDYCTARRCIEKCACRGWCGGRTSCRRNRRSRANRSAVRPAAAVRAASGIFSDALHIVKGFLVDDGLMRVLKPCIDEKDTAQKQKNKITYFMQKRNIEARKKIKKLAFSKRSPVSKKLRTRDAKSTFYRWIKLAIRLSPK